MAAQSLRDTIKEKIATALKENLKMDEREFTNPWSTQDKASVLQESRCFSDAPIDSVKCSNLSTRIIYLIQQGEKFTAQESTNLFFGVTKLFQAQCTRSRRMVYLVIKESEPSETEVFICMSCLIKDMNSKNDCFRANSIRVLSRVLDPAMAAQIDRYLKTAIVDKNPFVSSSALVCGMTLHATVPDVVKRWVNEIQETVNSKHSMVQFHASASSYELKKGDRSASHKVVTSMARNSLKSPMAECLLVRYATQTLMSERDATVERTSMSYSDSCLRHKSEMVTYEAARAFCQSAASDTEGASGHTVSGYDMTHATTISQIFLTSPKPVVRFGAIRTLNTLAQTRPQTASRCNCDMEPLSSDQNRNTATLALTTSSKTGHESNVERLVKQISSFMSDITEVFKVEVVRAVKGLCLLYPGKYKVSMSFSSSNSREDGTAEIKKDSVDALILIISQVPAAREVGLLHLCEFIEDCEYPNLCTRILGFSGEEVPGTSHPAKYIRFIYNRLISENALVRAAAVDALSKIAMKCANSRKDVLLSSQFGANDNDDEVRDRINLYSTVSQQCVDDNEVAKTGYEMLMSSETNFSVDALYDSLVDQMQNGSMDQILDFGSLPTSEAYAATAKAKAASEPAPKKPGAPAPKAPAGSQAPAQEAEQRASASAELSKVSQELGATDSGSLQHTCKPKPLTESEAEYTVQVIKHMFLNHMVLEMYVSNTVQGITLEEVQVNSTGLEPNWTELGASAVTRLEYSQNGSAHVSSRKNAGQDTGGVVPGSFGASSRFILKEEGDDLGYEDDYPVENVTIGTGDYMFPRSSQQGQFRSVWEQLTAQGTEVTQKLSLNFKTLESGVDWIIATSNMHPCDNTGKVEPGGRGHTALLSGTFLGGQTCSVKASVGMDAERGCVARVSARAKSHEVCQAVVSASM